MPRVRSGFILGVLLLALLTGCRPDAETTADQQDERPAMDATGQLHLTPDAQEAIGLQTETASQQDVQQSFPATGWLLARPASEVVVKAPQTGFLTSLPEGDEFALGTRVAAGQTLGAIQIVLTPQDQAQLVIAKEEADILIRQARASRELAEAQLKRLEAEAPEAVAGTRLNELREIIARSQAAEQEAEQQLPFLPREPYEDPLRLKPVPWDCPLAGRVVAVHARSRQLVVQGEPLVTVADWSALWLRVPILAQDLPLVLAENPLRVDVPGRDEPLSAAPVPIPQPTERQTQTIDLFYELENTDESLRPGQAVRVTLPTGVASSQVVIAGSAVLRDGLGNSWVYVRTDEQTFRRRRVELGPRVDRQVVVARGIEAGESVVTVGAQSLYGEEFRDQIPLDDDD